MGQWGGARAAAALRPVLSEVGCIPVSAMLHVPRAHEAFDVQGRPTDAAARWTSYAHRGLAQLEWWGVAARNHKRLVDPTRASPAFQTSPDERNATA
mmetsp:Transcript_6139/g.25729  ORF Transcript_6139/g.25729 Transcript_6139/m.25729 type:complete len:97 (+) Transcript_6139:1886-2176(+)